MIECPKCRGELSTCQECGGSGEVEPTRHELARLFKGFVSYSCTAERRNTNEWMEGLVEKATAAARALGYSGQYVLRNDRPAIVWEERDA